MLRRLSACWSAVLLVVACTPGTPPTTDPPPPTDPPPGHPDVVLRDRLGNALTADSTEPYSPRQTCGVCHDIDLAAGGYHFQQGRTDLSGRVVTRANYFGDGRTWIQSAGMFGKW